MRRSKPQQLNSKHLELLGWEGTRQQGVWSFHPQASPPALGDETGVTPSSPCCVSTPSGLFLSLAVSDLWAENVGRSGSSLGGVALDFVPVLVWSPPFLGN